MLPNSLTNTSITNNEPSQQTFETFFNTQDTNYSNIAANSDNGGFDLTNRYISTINNNRVNVSQQSIGIFILFFCQSKKKKQSALFPTLFKNQI